MQPFEADIAFSNKHDKCLGHTDVLLFIIYNDFGVYYKIICMLEEVIQTTERN